MDKLIRLSSDVYLAQGPISSIGPEEISLLRAKVAESTNGRIRINLHPDSDDLLHEMFIAVRPDSYIRPHKHPGKSEAFHIVAGEVDIVVFEDGGRIRDVVRLAAPASGKPFYYRMSRPFFHTLLIRSDLLVVHEITNGPFIKNGTQFADFAPQENADRQTIDTWHAELTRRAEQMR